MPEADFVKSTAGGCLLCVIASPGAAETAIEGVDEWRNALRIRIGAEAEGGKANDELVRFLSHALSLSTADVRIIRGSKSHRKVVFIPISREDAMRLLEVC